MSLGFIPEALGACILLCRSRQASEMEHIVEAAGLRE
jgi:hypothetical protein